MIVISCFDCYCLHRYHIPDNSKTFTVKKITTLPDKENSCATHAIKKKGNTFRKM